MVKSVRSLLNPHDLPEEKEGTRALIYASSENIIDGRRAEGLFLGLSAHLDIMMSSDFKITLNRLDNKKTAGFWFQELYHNNNAGSGETPYTYDHSIRVGELSLMLAKEMELCPAQLTHIHRGAFLHDIGKLCIPISVLDKSGRLTEEEHSLVYRHPELGSSILEKLGDLCQFKDVVRHHHERFDGKGYPDRLKGTDIPYEARIVSVADAFDAMTGPRTYRTAFSISEAMREMSKYSDSQFDPEIVNVLNEVVNKLVMP